METPAHRIDRWTAALEDLTKQESLLLRGGSALAATAIQQRIAPLVDGLVAHAADADSSARARIGEILERRRSSERWLSAALARGRAELRQMEADQRRLIRIRPAYSSSESGGRQLSAVG